MAEYRRAEIVSGLFILASVVVFALFAFKVIGIPIPFFEEDGVICEAFFADVETLDRAAKVTVGGHRIGTVVDIRPVEKIFTESEIRVEEERLEAVPAGWRVGRERHVIRVRFRITDPNLRIGEGASVAVAQEGFIGPYYLDIDPGTWDSSTRPPFILQRKGEIVTFETRRLDSLQDFIPMVRPILQNVESIIIRIEHELIAPLLDGKAEDLKKIIPELRASVEDAHAGINDVRRLLDPEADGSVARNVNVVLANADQSLTAIRKQLTDEVLPTLKSALTDGQRAMSTAASTLEQVKKVVVEADPKLKKVLDDLAAESGRLGGRIDELQKKLGTLLDDADHLMSLRQAEVAEIMRSLLNTAWEVELAARKIRSNPAVLIFGTEEQNRVEAQPRDDTGLRRSGRVKPYEQRDEAPPRKE